MGFRGKYQTKTSDGRAADSLMPPILLRDPCHRVYSRTGSGGVLGTVALRLLVRETTAEFQSAFMVRIADSWRPPSPGLSARVRQNCSVQRTELQQCTRRWMARV